MEIREYCVGVCDSVDEDGVKLERMERKTNHLSA